LNLKDAKCVLEFLLFAVGACIDERCISSQSISEHWHV